MPALEVDIARTHPTALSVQLECEPGEVVALVGPSGSGKSTTLKTIAGLLPGAKGTVRVGAKDWLSTERRIDLAAHHRRAGLVFQSYALFPHMTALGNVMAAAEGSKERRHELAMSWLGQVRMKGLEHRKPAQLSGGQQQRVALARALAREPEVLLLDEPFSAVDQMTRERLYEELAELRTRLSIPTVFVTHSIVEAQMLADRMVVVHRGRTLQAGTPDEVYRRPAEADVARLMGHKNVFPATVVRETAAGCVLNWQGLEVATHEVAPCGELSFVIPSTDVRIVEAADARPNAVEGRVDAIASLGELMMLRVLLPNGMRMAVSAPAHLVRRRGLAVQSDIRVALNPDAIHLMRPVAY
jgi:molybdate transport system ATP-binding protein